MAPAVIWIALGCGAEGPTPAADAWEVFTPADVEVAGDAGHVDHEDTSADVEDTGTSVKDTVHEDTSAGHEDTNHEDTSTNHADTSTSVEDTSTNHEDTNREDTSTDHADTSTDHADTSTSVEDTRTNAEDTSTNVEDTSEPPISPPEVVYAQGGARTLLFLNNPEQLIASDLGDAALGDKTLFRVTATGACRSFFEHVNRAGRTIGFGIQVYNPGPSTVTVAVRATGWVASIEGGVPFADALNGVGASAPVELAAGRSTWILRKDEAVSHGTFFSGVVDFDVAGGSVIVNHVAYDSFAGLDGSTTELGYVQRVEPDGTHEARMYKGVATASEADAGTLELALDDATPAGPLPIRVARFDLGAGAHLPLVEQRAWTSHIGPAQNASATTSDMVGFVYGPWFFDPLSPSDGEGRHPNLGNWGVVYRLSARVRNDGARQRRVSYRVTASPGAGAGLARQAQGGAWSAHRLERGEAIELGAVLVPANATRELVVAWVLGGPSGGGLNNEIVVE